MATVGQLIKYLEGFESDHQVVLHEDDFEGEGDFLDLGLAIQDIDADNACGEVDDDDDEVF